MRYYVLFGVTTPNTDEAKTWIEEALKTPLVEAVKEHTGRLYIAGDFLGEELKLCSGVSRDEEGEYPTDEDFPDWALLVYLDDTRDDSPWLRALEARPDRFVKLRTDRFED